ncbi:MAG: hypothetical protein AB2693_27675, partial [Candidatus Thiodiazotropha sp.]
MRYPEATAIETFIIYDWCSYMVTSGRMPDLNSAVRSEAFDNAIDDDYQENESIVSTQNKTKNFRAMVTLKKRHINLVHRYLGGAVCVKCTTYKYRYHKQVHPITKRVNIFCSKSMELENAKTVSSFVCHEFDRGTQKQKVDSGKFIAFGRICHFIE